MKSLTLLTLSAVLILLIQACNEPQESSTTSISFSIEGYGRDTIRLWQIEPLEFSKINAQQLIVDGSGSGAVEIAYPDNSFVDVQIGDFVFPIFYTLGSDLVIQGRAGDLPNTLRVSGEGSLPTQYTLAKKSIIEMYDEQDGRYFTQLDSTEFWVRLSALNKEIDSLNTWLATKKIDQKLESLLVLESQQQSFFYTLIYALVKRYSGAKYSVDMSYDKNLFMSYSLAYSMVLPLNYQYQLLGPTWKTSGASSSDSITNIFPKILAETIDAMEIPEFAKDYYIANMLLSHFGTNLSSPVIEDVYSHWQSKYPNSVFSSSLEKAIDNMSSLAKGEPAPFITGIDSYGNDFSTEQLKGKIIYIDIWATWCSGCVKNIPKMYALQEDFKDQNRIRFLFVSTDKDLDKWQNYISKLPGGGLHVNSNSTGLYTDYMISGIPHYIIVDASGNIYQSNAPDPDSNEIKSILEEAIKLAP